MNSFSKTDTYLGLLMVYKVRSRSQPTIRQGLVRSTEEILSFALHVYETYKLKLINWQVIESCPKYY